MSKMNSVQKYTRQPILIIIIILYTRNDMLINHNLRLSELKPDYYYFEVQIKKFRDGCL